MLGVFNGLLHYQSGSVAVKTISIAPASCSVGQSVKLTATVAPANATNMRLKWESSNPAIMTVSDDGTVTRHASGSVKITAYTSDGGTVKGSVDLLETSLSETKVSQHLQIYPNPASTELHYSLVEMANDLSVYSLTGEKLQSHIPDGSNKIRIDNLSTGVYLLVARTEHEIQSKRFAVIRN